MNELPVIGSLFLCKDFRDRHGANITRVVGRKYLMTKCCLFWRPKKRLWREINAFRRSFIMKRERIKIMVIRRKNKFYQHYHEICCKIYLLKREKSSPSDDLTRRIQRFLSSQLSPRSPGRILSGKARSREFRQKYGRTYAYIQLCIAP